MLITARIKAGFTWQNSTQLVFMSEEPEEESCSSFDQLILFAGILSRYFQQVVAVEKVCTHVGHQKAFHLMM